MSGIPAPSVSFSDCCQAINPCQAACEIENAMRDRWNNKTMRKFDLEGESVEVVIPSMSDLRALLARYKADCRAKKGLPARGFGRFSTPTCRPRNFRRSC